MSFPVTCFVVMCVLAVISAMWRTNLALNDPERYERLRRFERQSAEDRQEALRRAFGPLMPGAKKGAALGAGLLMSFLKKRR